MYVYNHENTKRKPIERLRSQNYLLKKISSDMAREFHELFIAIIQRGIIFPDTIYSTYPVEKIDRDWFKVWNSLSMSQIEFLQDQMLYYIKESANTSTAARMVRSKPYLSANEETFWYFDSFVLHKDLELRLSFLYGGLVECGQQKFVVTVNSPPDEADKGVVFEGQKKEKNK